MIFKHVTAFVAARRPGLPVPSLSHCVVEVNAVAAFEESCRRRRHAVWSADVTHTVAADHSTLAPEHLTTLTPTPASRAARCSEVTLQRAPDRRVPYGFWYSKTANLFQ